MKKNILLTLVLFVVSLNLVSAKSIGTEGGGGGDASEIRVNEIRSDILEWIKSGGAIGLSLPNNISYEKYFFKMTDILQPKKVIISFTENEVTVKGISKTCRGSISEDSKSSILCNISRFAKSSDTDQYKLIHHEFAGLVELEENEGGASDYSISEQLSDYLSFTTVLKLSIKKHIEKELPITAKVICLAGGSGVFDTKVFEADVYFPSEETGLRLENIKYAKSSYNKDVENLTSVPPGVSAFSLGFVGEELSDLILGGGEDSNGNNNGIVLVIKDNLFTTIYGTQFEVKCSLEK